VGRSWSANGSSPFSCAREGTALREVVEGGGRGKWLYFVLLSFASASISLRNDCSSLSAISSRVRGVEKGGVVFAGSGVD
jgi:hypothetical protein